MAKTLTCSTCGRRDTVTASEGPGIAGWLVQPSGVTCPQCVPLLPDLEEHTIFHFDTQAFEE